MENNSKEHTSLWARRASKEPEEKRDVAAADPCLTGIYGTGHGPALSVDDWFHGASAIIGRSSKNSFKHRDRSLFVILDYSPSQSLFPSSALSKLPDFPLPDEVR